jgi:hypothetical protein
LNREAPAGTPPDVLVDVDSICIGFDLRFHAEAHRAKYELQFHRLDPDAIRFVALPEEQLALVTDDWFHGISFG